MNQDSELLHDEPDQWPHGTLSFSKLPDEPSDTNSWRKVPLPDNPMSMAGRPTNSFPTSTGVITFYIVSCRIVEEPGQKKYVAHTIRIRKFNGPSPDRHPIEIERRYSDFLNLYLAWKKEFPALMANISFPRKVLIGNFSPGLLESRQKAFQMLLKHATTDEKLNQSASFAGFLQNAEQHQAHLWMIQKRYDLAVPLLENTFRLLNKIYTDRHPYVITTLCRLVACCAADPHESCPGGRAEKFAEIALRRFEAVSDADHLRFYVLLLQLCIDLWWTLGKDKQHLTTRLDELKRAGIRVDGLPTLLAVMLETKEYSVT